MIHDSVDSYCPSHRGPGLQSLSASKVENQSVVQDEQVFQ